MRISVPNLEAFSLEAMRRAEVCESDADITAEVLVTTDTWGVFTHGTKALGNYIRRVRGGGLRKRSATRILRESASWAIVDASSSLGMVASVYAMNLAIEKARSSGIAYVGLNNSCHFGAAGYYAAMALPHNMIGIALANDIPTVNGPGALAAVMGSNPFAFAAPAAQQKPILLDMATSTVAGGKVFAAAALGKTIPSHWLVDQNARPTTDPTLFPRSGSLTPMAGYKGFGLAIMIEVLSAALTGAAMNRDVLSWSTSDPSKPTGHGAAFIALDIQAFLPVEEFKKRLDAFIVEVRRQPRAEGAERILLPGELEWERREVALRSGIELPEDVRASLERLADETGLRLADYASA